MSVVSIKKNSLSPFKTIILMANPEVVGTHERTIEAHTKKIDLTKGWNGPAIAVVGYKDDSLYKKLNEGVHYLNGETGYGNIGVIDGHNRLKLAKRLKLKNVPLQLFPYRSKKIHIDSWLKNYTPLTAKQVVKHFKKPKSFVKPKATKHLVKTNKGVKKISEIQPVVKISSKTLVGV